MITLVTGTPGAGKTAWTVQELTRMPSQRKVYIHGIPELKTAHEPIYCTSELCEYCREKLRVVEDEEGQRYEIIDSPNDPVLLVEEWDIWATDGSLIVIDEVQRIWRPLNSSSNVPEEIAKLETHRHKGLDFWLISQGPHLFHSNVRLLVGRHIHLVANWRGRHEYEWPECRQNVTSRSDAVIRPYKLPKQVFKLYKSASLHTKLDKRKPLSFYVLCFCAVVVALIGYRIYNRINEFANPEPKPLAATEPTTLQPANAIQGSVNQEIKPKTNFPDFMPTLPGVPESAPAYAHLIQVKSAPTLAGCIKSANSCKCYTQQATPYPATYLQCLEQVANLKFNPYAETSRGVAQQPAVLTETKPAAKPVVPIPPPSPLPTGENLVIADN